MLARIYQPARNAMQSGTGKSKLWILEFAPEEKKSVDPLMGWTGSSDMRSQLKMRFDSQEAAVAYAKRNGLAYRIDEPKTRKPVVRPGGYGDNFAHKRRAAWTH